MVNKHLSNQKMNQKQLQYLICLKSGQNPSKPQFVTFYKSVCEKYNILLLDTNSEVICSGIALQILIEARFSKCKNVIASNESNPYCFQFSVNSNQSYVEIWNFH